ncbi:MAG: hypothetical protein KTR21_06130 [Rhodobacteraceae bacterium]|nr:hypothetical protein [Paracoccaceae bacterium]
MRVKACGVAAGVWLAAVGGAAVAQEAEKEEVSPLDPEAVEFYGSAEFEGSVFAKEPAFAGQNRNDFSFAIEPTLLAEWFNGDVALTVTPFLRWDAADDRRSHFDLREAKVDWRIGDWELTAGNDFVFWGRTEAQQLVDIINTVDGVEGLDEEEKLGQPMLKVTRLTDIGAFTGFYMPYFRERTFAGEGGRLRASIPVNDGDAVFLNGGGEWDPSFAVRWAHVIGDFDVGVHGFHGVSRDPALEAFQFDGVGRPTALRPVYDTISQVGLDGQYTSGPALWKLESIYRFDQLDGNLERQDYAAITGGVEYTFFDVSGSGADIGLILEGAYDSRGDAALTPFNEDVIGGVRLALNDEQDTSFLATSSVDLESGASILRLEAERRLVDGWKVELEGNAFLGDSSDDVESSFQDDSFVRVKLIYFW